MPHRGAECRTEARRGVNPDLQELLGACVHEPGPHTIPHVPSWGLQEPNSMLPKIFLPPWSRPTGGTQWVSALCGWGLKQGAVPHLYPDGMTRMARLSLLMLLGEEQHCGPSWLLSGTHSFLTGIAKIKSIHAVKKLLWWWRKALPCAFWAQGCVGLSFSRRRRQLLQEGSLVPSRMCKLSTPSESELRFGSAALVPWAPLTVLQKVAFVCTCLMESGCDCWALLRSWGCHHNKILLEKMSPSGVIIWASGTPRHVHRMPALDVKVSLGVKEFSEVLGQEISIFFVTHFVSVKDLPSPWSEIHVPNCCVMNPTSSGTPRVRNKMRAKKKQAQPNLRALSLLELMWHTDKILYASGHGSGALLYPLWCLQRKATLSASLLFLLALPGWSIYLG